MNGWKKNLLRYGITAVIGIATVFLTLYLHGYFELTDAATRLRLLSDAFTIPGVIMVMLGFLVLVANDGFFIGISYVVSYAFRMLIPGPNKERERYGDYAERKRKQGKVKSFGFLFLTGGAFVLIAVIFIVLFYQA